MSLASPSLSRSMSHRSILGRKFIGYLVLVLMLLIIIAPFYWMVITSFKGNLEISNFPPTLFPQHPTVSQYTQAFGQYGFGVYFRNSVIVSISATIIVVLLASMASYAIARLPIRGKASLMVTLLAISTFPQVAVISPLFILMERLGWLNSYQALIIPYTAFNLPFAIWVMRTYFVGIPKELDEAARVDGAGIMTTIFRVILPLATPGLFTGAIFTFVACWTEFFFALVFNNDTAYRTIPIGIALFSGQYTIPYGTIFAGSTVAVAPIVILVLLFQKWVVAGLTAGAVKG
ncbi:MAG: carbohydrate ABC transporter permease [Firmicutes bacterium]|nr:carbohydrate ABC transporter permease [Bacillota bacterium]